MRRKAPNTHLTERSRAPFNKIAWEDACSLLLRFLLLAAAVVAFLLCLNAVYALSVSMDGLWKFLLWMSLLSFLMAASRRRWIWILLFFLLAGWYAWQQAESLVQGWLLLLEQAMLPMDLVLPDALRQLMQPADVAVSEAWLQTALYSLLAVLLPIMAACTVAGLSAAGLLCCVLLPLLPGLVAGLVPPLFPAALLLLVCLMLTAYKRAFYAETEPLADDAETERTETAYGRGTWTAVAIGMIPIALVTLLLSTKFLPEQGYERPAYARQLRDRFLDLELETLFEAYNDGLSHGDLTRLSDIRFTGDAALAVRVSETRQLYLSGYTGAVFTGTRWENPLQSAYDRNAVGFSDPMPQNLHAALSDAEPFTISVRHIDAESGAMYLPNGLATPVDALYTAASLQDGALSAAEHVEMREYTVSALPFSAVPSGIAAEEDLTASYQSAALSAVQHADVSVQRSAENYVHYVTDTYTQLPEETRLAAERLCEQYGLQLSAENGIYDIAALCRSVRDVLRAECRYVYEPQSVPSGADFTTWFLQQSKEGYCVHFATAAAVLLRSMGIPTRYAEGYIVIRSDYDKPQDAEGYVLIEDTHAHAWAEVFDPVQMVWIPVEMTPSAGDAPQPTATPETVPEQTETPDLAEPEMPEPTPEQPTESKTESEEEPTEDPNTVLPEGDALPEESMPVPPNGVADDAIEPLQGGASADKVHGAVWALLLIPSLFCGIFGCRMLIKKRRTRRLTDSDANAAVLEAYRLVQKLLRFADCPTRAVGQSAKQYASAVAKERPALDAEKLAQLIYLAERAAFSEQHCLERERAEAVDLYEGLKADLAASVPAWKRALLWLRQP